MVRGATQGTLNQRHAARDSIRRALVPQPELVAAHVRLGVSYLFNQPKELDRARAEMELIIQLNPDEARAAYDRGIAGARRTEEARESFQEVAGWGSSRTVYGHPAQRAEGDCRIPRPGD